MTVVLRERPAAPADPTGRSAAPAASIPPSPEAAPPSAESARVAESRHPAVGGATARALPLVLGPDRAALLAPGVLDRAGVARLAADIASVAHVAVLIDLDLSGATHVDAQGARALLGQSYLLEGAGGGLRLRHAPPGVRRALRFYGAGHLLQG